MGSGGGGGGGLGLGGNPVTDAITGQGAVGAAVNPMVYMNNQAMQRLGLPSIGSMAGKVGDFAGSAFGAGISNPELAKVQQGVTTDQVNQAQQGVGNSLDSQQKLLAALQAQGGLGLQNASYNNLGSTVGNMQNTANQYQNIASGQGPNPAQAMLNQATGQNVANQAALMAGQRGAGSNVGLMARQAGMQGANTQQQAAGQGATMQANQSLNALQGLSGVQAQQAGVQANQANIANQMAGQQIAGTNTYAQNNLQNAGQLQGALGAYNNANVSAQGNLNSANASLLNTAMTGKQGVVGGVGQGLGSIAGLAKGGEVEKMAVGGMPDMQLPMTGPQPVGYVAPQSSFTQAINSWGVEGPKIAPTTAAEANDDATTAKKQSKISHDSFSKMGNQGLNAGISSMITGGYNRAKRPSANPATDADDDVSDGMAKGGLANQGGHVAPKTPSQKAVKSGNSYDNDKIPAMLSEGEIVIPRSVTQSKDPARAAADFVAKTLAKRKVKK